MNEPEKQREPRRSKSDVAPQKNSDAKTITPSQPVSKGTIDQWGTVYLSENKDGRHTWYVVHDGERHWEFPHLLSARRKFKRQAAKQGCPLLRK
jgi:hypothetical protein